MLIVHCSAFLSLCLKRYSVTTLSSRLTLFKYGACSKLRASPALFYVREPSPQGVGIRRGPSVEPGDACAV